MAVCLFVLDVRIEKPAFERLMSRNRRRTDYLRRVRIFLLVTQQWVPGVASVRSVSVRGVAVRVSACVFRVGVEVIPNLRSSDK